MRVGAVVLHYRFWPGIRAVLDSLLAQDRPVDEIIVVDNCSEDGSARRIRDAYGGRLTFVEASRNGGYAAGMNAGIGPLLHRGMDAILLLTHDCELRSDAVGKLVDRLEAEPGTAAVGPLLGFLSSREKVYSAGGLIDPITWEGIHHTTPDQMAEWGDKPPHEAEWLDGAAILFRSDALRQGGPLSIAYFMYFEECEYLLRLRRLGWKVECVPAAVGWQEPSMLTFPLEFRIRNRLRFLARNAPGKVLGRELSSIVLWAMKRTVLRPRKVREIWGPRLKGIADFALARNGPARSRDA
jgi:GT2 family glycosyltransferase